MPRQGKQPTSSPIPKEDQVRVGATIRTMREMRGFKPDEFANEVGISRPYLVNIEAGRKKLTNINLARVADALRVPQISIMTAKPEKDAA